MNSGRDSKDRADTRLDALPEAERSQLYDEARRKGADLSAVQQLDWAALRAAASGEGIAGTCGGSPDHLRFSLLARRAEACGIALGGGILEISPDGYGFLRALRGSYAPGKDDVYVSAGQLHHLGLRHGHFVEGAIRPPREGEMHFSLLRVESVNGAPLHTHLARMAFETATPVLPTTPIRLFPEPAQTRIAALSALAPWAHGHRVLVWAPEGSARLRLLADIAAAMLRADPALRVTACILDAEPTDAARFAAHSGSSVVSAKFDEPPARQVTVADLALAAAMREAEAGARAVLLLDSMTALARNGQRERPREGSLGPADVATHALVRCKRMFAAARQLDSGGSLTVLAAMTPGGELPVEREAASMFALKGNASIAFDALADEEMPCPTRTATRPEDLLVSDAGRQSLLGLRAALCATLPERRAEMFLARHVPDGSSGLGAASHPPARG